MNEYWKAIENAWNPEKACQTKKEDFIYPGDIVTVTKGRKVPIGTIGKVLRFFENPYDPITTDIARGTLVLKTAGLNVESIQFTNAKVQIELANGCRVYTYLKNIEKIAC